jgi:enterochelin esterase-like enzyme
MMAQVPKVACGTIHRLADFTSKFVDPRNVDIWFPDGYNEVQKYPVLYMHDGQMLFDSGLSWNKTEWGVDEVFCDLHALHQVNDCIVVGIWNTAKRHREYWPEKPFLAMSGEEQQRVMHARSNVVLLDGMPPVSDGYLKFIVTELKPYIDSHFSTLPEQANTFIAGSSMGALISVYAVCEYPEVFGGAACLSTHWPGINTTVDNPAPAAFLKYLETHLPSPFNHRVYFDYGSLTLDAMYKPYQQEADEIMKEKGYSSVNWITREFPGADHSEKSWNKRLAIPLLFLFSK